VLRGSLAQKTSQQKHGVLQVTCNTGSKSRGRTSLESPRKTPPPRSRGDQPYHHHPREIVPQDRRSNPRRQRGDQVRHRWREECTQVNHDLRYATRFMLNTFYLIITSEERSQRRTKPRKKSCCIRQDHESTPACVDQKDD
jgi:hypothetical protein